MNKTTRTIAASVVLATIAVAGCGSDEESSSTSAAPTSAAAATTAAPTTAAPTTAAPTTAVAGDTTAAAAGGAAMAIVEFKFSALTATAGEPISVTNSDSTPHTVTADDGAFDVSVGAGETTSFTVDTPGTYAIHCEIHTNMTGSITIN